MCGIRVQFDAVRIIESADVSCIFNDSNLHTKTETKVWNFMFSCIFCSSNHSFYTTVTETTRYNNSVRITKNFFCIFII